MLQTKQFVSTVFARTVLSVWKIVHMCLFILQVSALMLPPQEVSLDYSLKVSLLLSRLAILCFRDLFDSFVAFPLSVNI